jgi:peptidoglycan glycosyltransferase
VAKAFVDSLQAGHAPSLLELLDAPDGFGVEELARVLERYRAQGAIEALDVDLTGRAVVERAADGTPVSAVVPYRIQVRSRAAPQPFAMNGELPLRRGASGWKVVWSKGLLFPGINEPKARFRVVYRWPKRARILDRDGVVLARGSGEARTYPQGPVAGSVVGHLGRFSEGGAGRRAGDLVGASGLELGLEERLAGTPGARLSIVAGGKPVRELGEIAPQRAEDVRVTLDVDVQRAAELAFGSTVGGAVVIDPRSGDLLAVVSAGSFDPNNYVGAVDVTPFNRALSGLYPPGSAMKVVTAAAALDTGTVTASTRLTGPAEYKGVRNFESGEFGTIDFATATQHSVNTAYAQVAEMLGPRRLTRYAERFGFNRTPDMPLPAARSSFPFPEDLGDLMWSSIGQAQVLATPLQMATVAATVANGGVRMEPRVVLDDPERGERVIKRRTAAILTELMERVVSAGTGTAAQLGVGVAGKTGTAEVDVGGERRNHAWFIAFAPSSDPRVAVAVVSEYGGVGGQVAAPLARAILSAVLPLVD